MLLFTLMTLGTFTVRSMAIIIWRCKMDRAIVGKVKQAKVCDPRPLYACNLGAGNYSKSRDWLDWAHRLVRLMNRSVKL